MFLLCEMLCNIAVDYNVTIISLAQQEDVFSETDSAVARSKFAIPSYYKQISEEILLSVCT